jgi:8-oxo-dGTP pyrophosphatase MutT (NUDIX family)
MNRNSPRPTVLAARPPRFGDMNGGPALRDAIVKRLAAFEHRGTDDLGELRHAAVAIAVVDGDDGVTPAFLLTRRARALRNHPGQWALPGGRLDEGESAIDAVLRELEEEVGLRVEPDEVLGRLDDYVTRSGFAITPVVVWGGVALDLLLDPAEVAAVHRIPLDELDRSDSPRFVTIAESDRPVIQVAIGQDLIHAPTAAMLHQFAEVALHGRATRVDGYEQPVWAWG